MQSTSNRTSADRPPPTVLALRSKPVMSTLRDLTTMQRWEVLRRAGHALTSQQLADRCHASRGETQASLDALADAGFVVRCRATARRPAVTYRSVSDEVIVEWDRDDPAQIRWISDHRAEIRGFSRALIDRCFGLEPPSAGGTHCAELYRTPSLCADDVERIIGILGQARRAIAEIEEEARARAERSAGAADADTIDTAGRTAYLFALGFGPIGSNELPLPQVSIVDGALVTARLSELRTQPRAILSRKELQIALKLAAGRSRPEIAGELGLSANTVGTYTKRIYSKLGVRNRAEFTARMKFA